MWEPEIAIVVSPRDWAERLHRFVADHGGARVRARVLDAREALDDVYAVLVAEDLTSFLTPRLVEQLHARGRRLLGVHDPGEPWGRRRLEDLGIDETIEFDAAPEEFVRAIEALAEGMSLDRELTELVARAGTEPVRPDAASGSAPGGSPGGTLTSIGGPSGGVGVTEVALGLAVALAGRGTTTALLDGDELAPSLAQRLGLPLHPNLRTAIDAVEHRSGRLEDALLEVPGGGPSLLCGLPNPRDRHEVRPGEVAAVASELATRYRHVVINVSHTTEDIGAATGGEGSAITRTLLSAAEVVVGVGAPTPVGVARLLDWVADVRALAPTVTLHLVVNQAPPSRFHRGELEEELLRTFAPASLSFLPFDRHVLDAAWDGRPVTSGGWVRAVEELAARVLPPPVQPTTGRRRAAW